MSGVHACAPPTSRGRRSRRSLHCAEAPPLAPPEKHPSSLASSQLAAHEGSRPNPSGRRACLVSPPVGGKLLPFFPAELAAPRQAAVRATARTRLLPGAPSSGRARAQPFCSWPRAQNLLRYSRTWTSALAAWRATSAPTQRAYYPSPAVSQGSREISGPDHLVVQGRTAVFRAVRELSPVISTAAAGFHTSRLGGRAMGGVGRRDAVVVARRSQPALENTPAWIHVSTMLGLGASW